MVLAVDVGVAYTAGSGNSMYVHRSAEVQHFVSMPASPRSSRWVSDGGHPWPKPIHAGTNQR